jgi:hypothetical protein
MIGEADTRVNTLRLIKLDESLVSGLKQVRVYISAKQICQFELGARVGILGSAVRLWLQHFEGSFCVH